MVTFSRVAQFVLCLWYSLVPYAHVASWLQQFEPTSHDRWIALPWLLLESIMPAALVGAAAGLPIAWAFGRSASRVALCLSAPYVALSFYLLPRNPKPLFLAVVVLSAVSYVLFVVGATMLARRFLRHLGTRGNQ